MQSISEAPAVQSAVRHCRRALLRLLGDHGLSGDEQAGDRGCALQRQTYNLGRIYDACLHHVDIGAALRVEAVIGLALLQELADDDRAILSGIGKNLLCRRLQCPAHNVDADLLVIVLGVQPAKPLACIKERDATAGNDAFLDRCPGCMNRVIDTVLAFLDLDFGCAADTDDGDAARQFRQAFLQLLLVVIRGRLLDLRTQLRAATLDVLLLAGTVDDRRVLLLDAHLFCGAEHVERDVLELDAEVLADHLTTGQDGDVLEHGLAPIAEAGGLDRRDLEAAAQFVDDQRRQRLTLDILGDDQQRVAALHHCFEQGQDHLETGQLLLEEQDVRLLELADHLLRIGHEVRREIATVELHALDDVEFGFEALRLLDRDDALVADLVHRLRDHFADLTVVIGGDRPDLSNLGVGRDLFRALLDVTDDRGDGHVDAALQIHRVHPGGNRLGALAHDCLGEHRRGRRAVPGLIAGPGGDLLEHLRSHVLEPVGELDLLGDGYSILGDARGAVRLVEEDVAPLGAERHLHRVGENLDAAQHAVARVAIKSDFFSSHVRSPWLSGFPIGDGLIDHPYDVGFLHDHEVLAIELDLGARPLSEQHAVAGLDVERVQLATFVSCARADGDDFTFHRLLLRRVRDEDAAGGFCLRLDTTDQDSVLQWAQLHGRSPRTKIYEGVGTVGEKVPTRISPHGVRVVEYNQKLL